MSDLSPPFVPITRERILDALDRARVEALDMERILALCYGEAPDTRLSTFLDGLASAIDSTKGAI